jgi:hypothetical protein
MIIYTAAQLKDKLERLPAAAVKGTAAGMQKAVLNVEGESKRYCTRGQTPYYRAPYSDDDDPHREPPHMRDTIKGEVIVVGTSVHGTISTPKSYARPVHDGTSRMRARPFILDAIRAKDRDTRAFLSEGLQDGLNEVWQ